MAEMIQPSPEFVEKYKALGHAIQSGVAMYFQLSPGSAQLKHLRTGIDTSKADQYALARLLIEKGVITQGEYEAALLRALEEEKKRYEEMLTNMTGGRTKITLG